MSTRSLIEGILPLEPMASQAVAIPAGEAVDPVAPVQKAAGSRAALQPELADTVWRGNELSSGQAAFAPTGFAAPDAELPRGLWL